MDSLTRVTQKFRIYVLYVQALLVKLKHIPVFHMFQSSISNVKDPSCLVLSIANFSWGFIIFRNLQEFYTLLITNELLTAVSETEDAHPLFYSTEAQHMLFTVLCYFQYNKTQAGDICFRSIEFFQNFVVLSSLWLLCCEIRETAYFVPNSILSFPPSTCKGNK